jgi:cysteine desulfurase
MPEPIYLDHNATTPLLPEVADIICRCWKEPRLNPSSQHSFGRQARRTLEAARSRISSILGLSQNDRLVFTSGGTESNNLAVRGLLQRIRATMTSSAPFAHIIISALEHPSITELANDLQQQGHHVDRIPVDANGVVRVDSFRDLLRPDTAVVAVMLANNETGVIQPIPDLAALCNERNIALHCDAAQAVGRIPVSFHELGVATMTIAAHKFYGPVGIGALIIRHDIEIRPQLFGGFQQEALRPGTESVALAVGTCRALDLGYPDPSIDKQIRLLQQRAAHLRELRDRFEQQILAGWPTAVVIGAAAERLPNTSNIAFVGLDRQMLFMALDQAGVACSTGSACASGSSEGSPALLAMGLKPEVVSSALRFSFGVTTTAEEAAEAARRILASCNNLRR